MEEVTSSPVLVNEEKMKVTFSQLRNWLPESMFNSLIAADFEKSTLGDQLESLQQEFLTSNAVIPLSEEEIAKLLKIGGTDPSKSVLFDKSLGTNQLREILTSYEGVDLDSLNSENNVDTKRVRRYE